MNARILSIVGVLLFIRITAGLNCVSCVGWQNAGCNDPYNEATSDDLPVPGNTYCLKVVYSTYVERMAGGRACISGAGPGGSTQYCCSDVDYCNGTRHHTMPILMIISLIIAVLMAKFKLFC